MELITIIADLKIKRKEWFVKNIDDSDFVKDGDNYTIPLCLVTQTSRGLKENSSYSVVVNFKEKTMNVIGGIATIEGYCFKKNTGFGRFGANVVEVKLHNAVSMKWYTEKLIKDHYKF